MSSIKGTFGIYNVDTLMEENIELDGKYDIKMIKDERNYRDLEENINCQSVFRSAKVFYRRETENIKELILMFSEYTHKDIEGIEKCTSKPVQLVGGTVCPTRKELFKYASKKFIAFGRYIFGYETNHVRIVRNGKNRESTHHERNSKIGENEIILSVPPYKQDDYWTSDYIYSFMIFDHESGILDAFGLYH